MQQITEEQRNTSYEEAPREVRELYAAPKTGRILREVFEKHNLEERVYRAYALAIGDVMLGLISIEELPTVLAETLGVPQETAVHITESLGSLFATVPTNPNLPQVDPLTDNTLLLKPTTQPSTAPKNSSAPSDLNLPKITPVTDDHLELRPDATRKVPGKESVSENNPDLTAQPLSREEVLRSVTAKRTMASDIEAAKSKGASVPTYAKPFTDAHAEQHEDNENPQ